MACVAKVGESFMERNVEYFDVNEVRISICQQPEIMGKNYATEHVDEVMTSEGGHKHALEY